MARNNKTIDAEINEISHPEEGTRYPAGKPDTETDALHKRNTIHETVREAKEADGNLVKTCLDKQLGRGTPTGGKIGNGTTQPQADGCVDDL